MRRTIAFALRGVAPGFTVLALAACGAPAPGDDDDDDIPDAAVDALDAPSGDVDGNDSELADVYAHTGTTLYKIDPDTYVITEIGPFTGDAASDEMTDLAVDGDGLMVGISFSRVYIIDSATAVTTRAGAGELSQEFTGLSFVPSMEAFGTPGPDVLIAGRNSDGAIFQIDPTTGGATQIGDMGPQFAISGDIVAVRGFGIVATSSGGALTDALVRLAPNTFAATVIGSGTGYHTVWGIGFWKNQVFGFTESGDFITIDTVTGAGTLVENNGLLWWGAAVTTSAPVID